MLLMTTGVIIGYGVGSLFGNVISARLRRIAWFDHLTTVIARLIDRIAGYRS
jgi:hypothetical protein